MILLLMASMLASGGITFGIYKALQLYYRSEVLFENPLTRIRYFMRYEMRLPKGDSFI